MNTNGRAKAGKSDNSHRKHRMLARIVRAQANAYRYRFPKARILLIDTNAGDGQGIAEPQLNFWEEETSCPSPRLLASLTEEIGATGLIACEKLTARRESLRYELTKIAPMAVVLDDNKRLLDVDYGEFDWGLLICDPCGPSIRGEGYPIEVLQHITSKIKCDVVLTLNVGALERITAVGTTPKLDDSSRVAGLRRAVTDYLWMWDLKEWKGRLNRKYAARSPLVYQSRGFKFQFVVVANYLANHIGNKWEVYPERNP